MPASAALERDAEQFETFACRKWNRSGCTVCQSRQAAQKAVEKQKQESASELTDEVSAAYRHWYRNGGWRYYTR